MGIFFKCVDDNLAVVFNWSSFGFELGFYSG